MSIINLKNPLHSLIAYIDPGSRFVLTKENNNYILEILKPEVWNTRYKNKTNNEVFNLGKITEIFNKSQYNGICKTEIKTCLNEAVIKHNSRVWHCCLFNCVLAWIGEFFGCTRLVDYKEWTETTPPKTQAKELVVEPEKTTAQPLTQQQPPKSSSDEVSVSSIQEPSSLTQTKPSPLTESLAIQPVTQQPPKSSSTTKVITPPIQKPETQSLSVSKQPPSAAFPTSTTPVQIPPGQTDTPPLAQQQSPDSSSTTKVITPPIQKPEAQSLSVSKQQPLPTLAEQNWFESLAKQNRFEFAEAWCSNKSMAPFPAFKNRLLETLNARIPKDAPQSKTKARIEFMGAPPRMEWEEMIPKMSKANVHILVLAQCINAPDGSGTYKIAKPLHYSNQPSNAFVLLFNRDGGKWSYVDNQANNQIMKNLVDYICKINEIS